MTRTFLNQLRHPIISLWRSSSLSAWRRLPHPGSDSTAHATGPDADRLLLVGGGIAVGYGALHHDLALGGHLVRRLAELTGRGALVNVHAAADSTLADARDLLNTLRVGRFDAVVLAFGGSEAATLRSPHAWKASLQRVLASVGSSPEPVHVFVVGIPLLGGLAPRLYGALARRCAARLNAQSREVCAHLPHATYVDLEEPGPISREMDRRAYDRWTRRMAPQLVGTLNAIACVTPSQSPIDEVRRQEAVDALGGLNAESKAALEEIVDSARNLFGVENAAVHLIDGEKQVAVAHTGQGFEWIHRKESICDFTIRHSEILIVQDTMLDDRFKDRKWATLTGGVRFYAGYPLESPEGERVGVLCIIDSEPREFEKADGSLLRELALRVQAVLWPQLRPAEY